MPPVDRCELSQDFSSAAVPAIFEPAGIISRSAASGMSLACVWNGRISALPMAQNIISVHNKIPVVMIRFILCSLSFEIDVYIGGYYIETIC